MHKCTVDRSATAVKLKVNDQFEIFLKSTVKPLHFFDVYSQIGQESSEILAIKLTRV